MTQRGRPRSSRTSRRPRTGPPGRGEGLPGSDAQTLAIPPEGIRLNRYMARAGVCSRRKADALIAEGRVKVNGRPATVGQTVYEHDEVEVGGRVISPRPYVYILLNKPDDVITTVQDERSRRTVMDLVTLPDDEKAALFPVGRLDRHTLGVLLLTNDGELAHRLMHPRYAVEKLYRVRTREPIRPHELDALRRGVDLDDGPARADRVAYLHPPDHHEIGLMLHEGRNRQVRRMLEALGHEVVELERVQYAGLTTEGLRRGKWRRLEPHEIRRLRRLVKLT
ncbi:MAG: rRNA pseudouridine synthase [Bacteroidetes bacterium]|nr:MAG: rRNA pseudouridine synthase [Bacteroidota bacterium]